MRMSVGYGGPARGQDDAAAVPVQEMLFPLSILKGGEQLGIKLDVLRMSMTS